MKQSNVNIDELINCYMVSTIGACITIYSTPEIAKQLRNKFNLIVPPFRLNIFRFNDLQEATKYFNLLVSGKLKPVLWNNGVKQ